MFQTKGVSIKMLFKLRIWVKWLRGIAALGPWAWGKSTECGVWDLACGVFKLS